MPEFDESEESSEENNLQEPHPCISEDTVKVTVLQVLVTRAHLDSEILGTSSNIGS